MVSHPEQAPGRAADGKDLRPLVDEERRHGTLANKLHRLLRRDYLLPLWTVIPFFVEGRSAPGPAAIPLAMLAAVGLVDVVLAAIQKPAENARVEPSRNEAKQSDTVPSVERNVFIYLVLYLIFSAYQFGFQLSNAKLYPPDQEGMAWVRENTPANARFLVLTGTTSVSCDSVLEWFPARYTRPF